MIYFNRLLEITGLQCSDYYKWNGKTNDYVNMLERCTSTNDSNKETCPCHFGPTVLWENPSRTNVNFLPDIGYDSIFVVTPVHNTTPLMPSTFVFNAFSTTVWVCIGVLVVMFTVMKMLDPRFAPKEEYTWADTIQHQQRSQHQQQERRKRRYTMNGGVRQRHNDDGRRRRSGNGGGGGGGHNFDGEQSISNNNNNDDDDDNGMKIERQSTVQLKRAASTSKRVAARSKYFALKSRHVYRLRKAFQSTGTLVFIYLFVCCLFFKPRHKDKYKQYDDKSMFSISPKSCWRLFFLFIFCLFKKAWGKKRKID